ncbi:unnamed protein product [Arabis nemorensis]|uniref:Uncharacterized protein n=1 Tax=Arabis nemorensis TaxID=586526 RepID=A0A565BTJ7_9BRAS|nr:unnamed protein product [Arabis nemorensis]
MLMMGRRALKGEELLGLLLPTTTAAEESPEGARLAVIAHVVGLLRERSKGRKGHIDLMALESRGEGFGGFLVAKEITGEGVTVVIGDVT